MAENADIGNVWSIFCHFNTFKGIIPLQNLVYLVQEVLSFKMSGITLKLVKNWLRE